LIVFMFGIGPHRANARDSIFRIDTVKNNQ